jgi:RNA polymerase sigma factor (TIGR02999 family)
VTDITEILRSVENGDRLASDKLLPLVYEELRNLAAAKLSREAAGHTLQPTALVHEAYLRLVGDNDAAEWENRRHFFSAAAEAMRRILVERARRKASVKHGGEFRRLDYNEQLFIADHRPADLIALDEAIGELERHDARAAQLVKLRHFAGLSQDDAAAVMQISQRTADRMWRLAKVWLYERLTNG